MSNTADRIFGERIDGVEYQLRPGSYVVIQHEGRVAIVKATSGYCLPGGGQEPGETPEDAAIRECWEEVGLRVKLIRSLGYAEQLAYGIPEERYFQKQCTFFLAELADSERGQGEHDHELHWMTMDDALKQLVHESERWIVGKVYSSHHSPSL